MTKTGNIIVADGLAATVGVLKTDPADLDALVTRGVKQGHLRLVA
jgi:hydroxymethylglutaryl-CoA reductase